MFIFIKSPFILVLASQFSVSLVGLRIVELELEDTDYELLFHKGRNKSFSIIPLIQHFNIFNFHVYYSTKDIKVPFISES